MYFKKKTNLLILLLIYISMIDIINISMMDIGRGIMDGKDKSI